MKIPFSNKKTRSISIRNEVERRPVPIHDVGAIGIAGHLSGRIVPVIIADLNERPDIREVIRIHEHSDPGDMKMQWGLPEIPGIIRLILEFHRPVETLVLFDFSIVRFGVAVDAIFRNRMIYIQAGTALTKISDDPNAPKILCEIPSTGVEDQWDRMFKKALVKTFRLKGLSRSAAKNATTDFINTTRSFDDELWRSLNGGRFQ